ncbi:unnamed protein product [Cylicocyclus nassatus]|uniref:Glycosyltransferase family 92 protein n=1 Tax=Cylicocyclus nassatus TaxID=53992 RepID=A0AA36DJ93_CYLNA|nr:unnamed protein product [Cylicocyclus nassatus]
MVGMDWSKLNYSVESEVLPEFSVHCCRHPEAFYMGITESKNDKVVYKVPVLDRTVDKPIYKLSVCLAPIYGNETKWLMLAELIEHYKLQGVQHFYVYVKDIDDYSRILIDDYEKSGEIEVVYFKKEQDRFMMDWQPVGVVVHVLSAEAFITQLRVLRTAFREVGITPAMLYSQIWTKEFWR